MQGSQAAEHKDPPNPEIPIERNRMIKKNRNVSAKGCPVGTEEQLIKFRPSPNFKNMKKFLKSKIVFTENSNQSPVHGADLSPPNTSSDPITSVEEQRALLERAQPAQPPLPLEPPPVSHVDFSLPHKREIEDHEYQGKSGSPTLSHHHQEETLQAQTNYETSQTTDPSEKPAKTICRDFIRGTCTRAGCKYAHERDLSQLFGVYTFCRNYQNSVCTYPYCKYVHASIFEEQRFYRTGVLPPKALAHHKKPAPVLPPPPPPPPPEEPVLPPALEVPVFLNPPPALVPSVDKPVISCVPTANLESRPIEDFIINPTPRDRDLRAKKCKNCDTMEFSLQFNKDKTDKMRQTSIELKNKVALLTNKTHMLYTVIISLMNPQASKRPEGLNGLSTLLNIVGDSEKKFLSNLLPKEFSELNLVTGMRDS